jgi:hypothetical protein
VQYTCGIGQHQQLGDGSDVCDVTGEIDPSDLNYPTIAVGDLAGKQTITRTVTNATRQASVYFAQVQAPAGYSVKVTPTVLTVLPNRSATYTVEITRTSAAIGAWSFGSLTWADLRGHSVRSTLALRASDVAAVAEVGLRGTSGSLPLKVRAGFNGTLTSKPFGLVESAISTKHLVGVDVEFNPAAPAENPAVGKFTVNVPAGSKVARFATFDSDYPSGTDLDMYVYKDGVLVGTSGGGSAEESVTVTAAGSYDIYIVQFSLAGSLTEQDVNLHAFVVGSTVTGNLTATPTSQPVQVGKQVQVTAAWTGLTAGKRYLGVIEYSRNNGPGVDQTVISIQA